MLSFRKIKSCPECHGNGRISNPYQRNIDDSHLISNEYISCPRCKGKGMIEEMDDE